jgi:hypothetical protein
LKVAPSLKKFDTFGKSPIDPRKQAEVERMKLAKSTNYQKELKKELGPPPKNL